MRPEADNLGMNDEYAPHHVQRWGSKIFLAFLFVALISCATLAFAFF